MSRLATRPALAAVSPLLRPLAYLTLLLLLVGSTGCATRAERPDADVTAMVEREDRRLAQLTAVAAVDMDPFELMSPGLAIESMALLVVGDEKRSASTTPDDGSEPLGAAPGWFYDAPAAWGPRPWSFAVGEGMDGSSTYLRKAGGGDKGSEGALAIEAGDGNGKGGKPKVRFNFLRMRVKDRPISFSGSLKGLKAVQVKATIKL